MPDINPVPVKKDELLGILRSNRDRHSEKYEKARAGWRKAMERELHELLDKVDNGLIIGVQLANIPPEDHTGDYNDAIDMLEMSIDNEVMLSQAQFRCYVKDKWGWQEQWTTSNSQYMS
jgi:hypothetical protein